MFFYDKRRQINYEDYMKFTRKDWQMFSVFTNLDKLPF
jgi:hypothetical protein